MDSFWFISLSMSETEGLSGLSLGRGVSRPFLMPSSVSGLISPFSILRRICSASTWKIFSMLVPYVSPKPPLPFLAEVSRNIRLLSFAKVLATVWETCRWPSKSLLLPTRIRPMFWLVASSESLSQTGRLSNEDCEVMS
mgnify:CR=1 FL=1